MNNNSRTLDTRRGAINFPAYIPVTTFGSRYPLDNLIRPYLPRLSQAMMVSFHYARQLREESVALPLLVDSGGFASLFEGSGVRMQNGLGVLKTDFDGKKETIHPGDVLELQERIADVAFTLDFPVPPSMNLKEARKRQRLTVANALWAQANRRRRDLRLYAVVQAWDEKSAAACAREYKNAGFDGIAIGGLVPRSRNIDLVAGIVEAVKNEIGDDLPLHVFGLGKPEIVERLFRLGVDSVDSSSYVKMAADGKLWGGSEQAASGISTTNRLHLALCNLAGATGASLPLSAARLVFSPVPYESPMTG